MEGQIFLESSYRVCYFTIRVLFNNYGVNNNVNGDVWSIVTVKCLLFRLRVPSVYGIGSTISIIHCLVSGQ